ncbi:MAG: IS630 family transposase [Anaerolineaceae bacterium]|nr:IS630 family transposase [Anaerolineaceae bacterium]
MPRKAIPFAIREDDRSRLEEIFASKNESRTRVDRCRILIELHKGTPVMEIASQCAITTNTVRNVRERYQSVGMDFLKDLPRPGRPRKYTQDDEIRVLRQIDAPPPPGHASWDGTTLSQALDLPDDFIWATLRKHNICLCRRRSWCVSTDPQFDKKAADIIGLYLNPPENAIVISVDEKPGIQALSRTQGYVYGRNGAILRAYKSTYRRNGTLNLFAALTVASGEVFGKVTSHKRRPDFQAFLDDLMIDVGDDQSIDYHIIVDNYCIHKNNDEWLKKHPNVFFHYTPTSASWLNQVEIWFNIMSRKVLRDGNFDSREDLKAAIENYIANYSEHPHPFVWRKREVKGSQIADKLNNLIN